MRQSGQLIRRNNYAGNTEDEKRLYELIWQRTLASQMKKRKSLSKQRSLQISQIIPEMLKLSRIFQ